MDRPARSPLTPRLLLVVAVLACLFGWGHSVASAASATQQVAQPVAAVEQAVTDAGHAGHAEASPAESGRSDGDGGHASGHEHSVSCMASSAASAFGAVATLDALPLVIAAVPPQTPPLAAAPPVEAHRAPSIATLCVLRT